MTNSQPGDGKDVDLGQETLGLLASFAPGIVLAAALMVTVMRQWIAYCQPARR